MAKPITTIEKHIPTPEEAKNQKLEELTSLLADNDAALNQTIDIIKELHASGLLEAAHSALKAKEKIAKIAVGQVSREPAKNIINNLMSATGLLANMDPEVMTKLIGSLSTGIQQGNEHLQSDKTIGMLDLLKVLKDPDVNRAIGFGIQFLKGLGKGLNE
ncbi:DUF1641 domain-containing protein [Priestia koreensis]|uniref:DUF1641 domain-containing protein n=1 Tax=Priestia koreensis TaxID=284581 RepID=UPI001F59A9CF|nr:DUF1641 domain-containing protein [Priestia koreensis]UNL83573.1 DUF1641 domain-containing protein [Priestia koreensis]